MKYIKGLKSIGANRYRACWNATGSNPVPLVTQHMEYISFSNLGSLNSQGQPVEIVTHVSLGNYAEGITPLVTFNKGAKYKYIRIEVTAEVLTNRGTATISASAVLDLPQQPSYWFRLTKVELDSRNRFVFKTDWGNTFTDPISQTDVIEDYYINSYNVYHAANRPEVLTQTCDWYSDPIPLKQLANNTNGICVSDFSTVASSFRIMYFLKDASSNAVLSSVTLQDFRNATNNGVFSAENVLSVAGIDSTYVIFCSNENAENRAYVTNKPFFVLQDIPVPVAYTEIDEYCSGGNMISADGWQHTTYIKLTDLRNCADGWCIDGHDSGDGADIKIEFFDSNLQWLSSVMYEDAGSQLSCEEIFELANATPTADYVVFNFNSSTWNEASYPWGNLVFVDGRCKTYSNNMNIQVQAGLNTNYSTLSNAINFIGSTHVYNQTTQSSTCLSEGYTTYTCMYCDDESDRKRTPLLKHLWGDTVYTWSGNSDTLGGNNLYSCTARRVCSGNNTQSHEEVLNGEMAYDVIQEPTTSSSGKQTVTAYFYEDWAYTQIKTNVNMFPRCYAPVSCTVSKSHTADNEYEIAIGNKNIDTIGHECVVKFTDEDGVLVFADEFLATPRSGSAEYVMSTFIAELSSSVVPVHYTMYFRGNASQSDSVVVSGTIS